MAFTSRPSENQDPWYEAWTAYQDSVESEIEARYRGDVVDGKDAAIAATVWARQIAPIMVPGVYYGPFTHGLTRGSTSMTTASIPGGQLRIVPFYVPEETTFDQIGVNVTTAAAAGGMLRLGVFDYNRETEFGTLVFDAGEIAADVTGERNITTNFTLSAGQHWLAMLPSLTLSVHAQIAGSGLEYTPSSGSLVAAYANTSVAYGAFPASIAIAATATLCVAIYVRAS